MIATRRIAAIGGGGFLLDDERLLQERWLLSLLGSRGQPRVLYLGTAAGDDEGTQLKFMLTFTRLDCRPDTLCFFPYDMARDYGAALRGADLIYVGGGNTVAMLAVWREFGFDRELRAAYDGGSVLAGISAGANCWFERYVTDSVPGGGVRAGLGFLGGSFSPHLDGQAWRRPILAATEGPAAGAGDHVCILYEDEQWREAVHDRPADRAGAPLCLLRSSDDASLSEVVPRPLGAPA